MGCWNCMSRRTSTAALGLSPAAWPVMDDDPCQSWFFWHVLVSCSSSCPGECHRRLQRRRRNTDPMGPCRRPACQCNQVRHRVLRVEHISATELPFRWRRAASAMGEPSVCSSALWLLPDWPIDWWSTRRNNHHHNWTTAQFHPNQVTVNLLAETSHTMITFQKIRDWISDVFKLKS